MPTPTVPLPKPTNTDMPFIPHTDTEVQDMLAAIGVRQMDELFEEIPTALHARNIPVLPLALNEMAMTRLAQERAAQDAPQLNFIGAGGYEHHIPAAIWQLTTRGEFYSAYTPYQAEASQGSLQVIYEYQSMITALTGLDVSNASLYDGASALAEAILMAVRTHKNERRILMPRTVSPFYRQVVATLVAAQGIEVVELPYDPRTGTTSIPDETEHFAALVIPQPNFFGQLEDVDALTDWAHQHHARVIALVNPISLGLLKAPGTWGATGADIATGEGQSLGCPLSNGGPWFGFMTCRRELVRQMPGRLVGRTRDLDGKSGFTLTLQAREQHIRRAKATSNICSNQGLMVVAATLYLSLMGAEGLARTAQACHRNTRQLIDQLSDLPSVKRVFQGAGFHEALLRLDRPVRPVLDALLQYGIVGGLDVSAHYPELGHTLLVCATETRTPGDIEHYTHSLHSVLEKGLA